MAGENAAPVATELAAGERLSRFLFGDRHYSSTKRLVKPGAFDPSPYRELSVGHTTGLTTAEVWSLGEVVRIHTRLPKLYARADIDAAHVVERKLKAIRDDEGYERHTNILGWPDIEDPDTRKRVWKNLATGLADSAALALPTD
jgi:hypothetical protein